jgi:serine/threonine protein kinase
MQCNKLKSEHLIFYEKLGSGQFGDVYRGVYRLSSNQSIEVAIKKLKLESSDLEVAEKSLITTKFLREASK